MHRDIVCSHCVCIFGQHAELVLCAERKAKKVESMSSAEKRVTHVDENRNASNFLLSTFNLIKTKILKIMYPNTCAYTHWVRRGKTFFQRNLFLQWVHVCSYGYCCSFVRLDRLSILQGYAIDSRFTARLDLTTTGAFSRLAIHTPP